MFEFHHFSFEMSIIRIFYIRFIHLIPIGPIFLIRNAVFHVVSNDRAINDDECKWMRNGKYPEKNYLILPNSVFKISKAHTHTEESEWNEIKEKIPITSERELIWCLLSGTHTHNCGWWLCHVNVAVNNIVNINNSNNYGRMMENSESFFFGEFRMIHRTDPNKCVFSLTFSHHRQSKHTQKKIPFTISISFHLLFAMLCRMLSFPTLKMITIIIICNIFRWDKILDSKRWPLGHWFILIELIVMFIIIRALNSHRRNITINLFNNTLGIGSMCSGVHVLISHLLAISCPFNYYFYLFIYLSFKKNK